MKQLVPAVFYFLFSFFNAAAQNIDSTIEKYANDYSLERTYLPMWRRKSRSRFSAGGPNTIFEGRLGIATASGGVCFTAMRTAGWPHHATGERCLFVRSTTYSTLLHSVRSIRRRRDWHWVTADSSWLRH